MTHHRNSEEECHRNLGGDSLPLRLLCSGPHGAILDSSDFEGIYGAVDGRPEREELRLKLALVKTTFARFDRQLCHQLIESPRGAMDRSIALPSRRSDAPARDYRNTGCQLVAQSLLRERVTFRLDEPSSLMT
jgi:hypothetical protein